MHELQGTNRRGLTLTGTTVDCRLTETELRVAGAWGGGRGFFCGRRTRPAAAHPSRWQVWQAGRLCAVGTAGM